MPDRSPFEEVVGQLRSLRGQLDTPTGLVGRSNEDRLTEYDRRIIQAVDQIDGLLKLVEERPDPACSDPNCSYRAEVGLLAEECQGAGCRLRGSGHHPEGEPSDFTAEDRTAIWKVANTPTTPGDRFLKLSLTKTEHKRFKEAVRKLDAIDHPQDRDSSE